NQAIKEAKETTANVYKLLSAFVKYAKGTDALIKKAHEEAKMAKRAQEEKEDKNDALDMLLADDSEDTNNADAGNPHEDWQEAIKGLKDVMNPPAQNPNQGGRAAPKTPVNMAPKKDPN